MHVNKIKYLLVDGYNVINSWDLLKDLANISLDDAREKLVDILSEFRSMDDEEIVLVFDSYLQKGVKRSVEQRKNITVVFTQEHETADNYIEKLVFNAKRNEIFRVASSDSIIQTMVLRSGAIRLSSQELLLEYNNKKIHVVESFNRSKRPGENIVSIDRNKLSLIEDILKDKL